MLPPGAEPPIVEQIRRTFAAAWGEIGAAWGVAPSTAAVQGYLLTHGGPLTEPEIRRALGLSHRAASVALDQCEEWGLIQRSASRRSGLRGPPATAYLVVGDNWEWFRRVAAARKERETDPVMPVIERCAALARDAAAHGHDPQLDDLTERLDRLLRFVHQFDRGVAAFVAARPEETATIFAVIGALDAAALQRLFALVGTLPAADVAEALATASRLSPSGARRLLSVARRPSLLRLLGLG